MPPLVHKPKLPDIHILNTTAENNNVIKPRLKEAQTCAQPLFLLS